VQSIKNYLQDLSATINRKGVLDVDTVKGCSLGMAAHPNGGCYGLCYACKISSLYGFDFSQSVDRKFLNRFAIEKKVIRHPESWFRIGTMGDPCHNWDLTVMVCRWLGRFKTPVIITKHWIELQDSQAGELKKIGAIINTSISPLDTHIERVYRLNQFNRMKRLGLRSVLRIVSCNFGATQNGKNLSAIQYDLFKNAPVIDNPLRIPKTDGRVVCGDILVEKHKDLGGGSTVSVFNKNTYLGTCGACPDKCGVTL